MKYLERSPSPRLAAQVKCFWSLSDDRKIDLEPPEPVIPDGCVEVVFNLADRFRRYYSDGSFEQQPSSLVAGQIERSIQIGPTGEVRLFGIRFRPAGAFPFFDIEMSRLTNRIEPLETVWGTSVAEIEERLWAASTFDEQVLLVEDALLKRMRRQEPADPWLTASIEFISAHQGTGIVRSLSRSLGISERGLERRFSRFIGLSPKAFCRITRFQNVLQAIQTSGAPNILDIAHQLGYYDQSHLIRDFRQYSDMSPSRYIQKAHGITQLFANAP